MAVVIMMLRILAAVFDMLVIGFTVMWYLEAKQSKTRLKTACTMIAFSMLNIIFACAPCLQ